MKKITSIIPVERIERKILFIRGMKVMLSIDLAELYGVEHRTLNQAVKRNPERFPRDFMFQLTAKEFENLKSQSVISSWGGLRSRPYAFTEAGVAMLSSVLTSKKATAVNIAIVRTFAHIRQLLSSNTGLEGRLEQFISRTDKEFRRVYDILEQLLKPPSPPRREIGFKIPKESLRKS